MEDIGQRITTLFRERGVGQRYVARGLIDRDESALQIFDWLVALVESLDSVILLEHAINRRLPAPLRSDRELERWRKSTTSLFREGLYRPAD